LIALAVLIAAWHLSYYYRKPFSRDIMCYAVIAHEMLAGRELYSDLWDHKPPAIYVTYAVSETIFGYGWPAIYFIHVTALIFTLFGVYSAVRVSVGGRGAGLWAAVFWAFLSGDIYISGDDPNTEVFISACLTWAFFFFVQPRSRTSALGRSMVIGALFALASLYKPMTFVAAALMCSVHLVIPRLELDWRRRLSDVCVIVMVGALTWSAVIGYFIIRGRYKDFYETMFVYNSYYAGNIFANLVAPLRHNAKVLPSFLVPLAVVTVAGLILGLFKEKRFTLMLTAFLCATWIMICSTGRFYAYYYLLWVAPLSIGTGWTLGLISQLFKRRAAWLPLAMGAALLLVLSKYELPSYRKILGGDYSQIVPVKSAVAERMGRKINDLLAPGESFFLWGDEPGLYFWSHRPPPTGIIYERHLQGPLAQKLTDRALADFESVPPELFIIEAGKMPSGPHPLKRWFTERYQLLQPASKKEPYDLFVRRGGRINQSQ
jgi:hypothetical protein